MESKEYGGEKREYEGQKVEGSEGTLEGSEGSIWQGRKECIKGNEQNTEDA